MWDTSSSVAAGRVAHALKQRRKVGPRDPAVAAGVELAEDTLRLVLGRRGGWGGRRAHRNGGTRRDARTRLPGRRRPRSCRCGRRSGPCPWNWSRWRFLYSGGGSTLARGRKGKVSLVICLCLYKLRLAAFGGWQPATAGQRKPPLRGDWLVAGGRPQMARRRLGAWVLVRR